MFSIVQLFCVWHAFYATCWLRHPYAERRMQNIPIHIIKIIPLLINCGPLYGSEKAHRRAAPCILPYY